MESSRRPAWEGFSSKVPAYRAVRCQRTDQGGGWRKDRERASHNQLTGHSKSYWDDDESERDRDVTNRGFPHQRYKPSKPRPQRRRAGGLTSTPRQ